MYNPVIDGNYKVTRDTGVIPIVEHKDYEIHWSCSTSVYADAGEPETLKEAMTRSNRNLCKISDISEVYIFLSRKAWIPKKEAFVKGLRKKARIC